jgi:hypothetical protein
MSNTIVKFRFSGAKKLESQFLELPMIYSENFKFVSDFTKILLNSQLLLGPTSGLGFLRRVLAGLAQVPALRSSDGGGAHGSLVSGGARLALRRGCQIGVPTCLRGVGVAWEHEEPDPAI